MEANFYEGETIFSAGGILVDGKSAKVYLIYKDSSDEWLFPKGRIERGELIEEAVEREIHEETGYKNTINCLLRVQVRPDVVDSAKSKVIFWFLALLLDTNQERNTQMRNENFSGKWLSKEEAMPLLRWEGDKKLLEKAFAVIQEY